VPHFAYADEQLLYTLATQILRDHFVAQATFDAALAEWGEAGLVDIIGCLGNFSMLDEPPFPDVRDFAKVSDPQS
jgi:4-carboxymuconolactone decarboxylase